MSPKPFAVVFCGVLALSGSACKDPAPDSPVTDQARWPENVLAAEVRPLDTSRMAVDEFSQLLGQAASVPGVEQVAVADVLPSAERPRTQIDIDGRPSPLRPGGFVQIVSPGYFATMELRLLQGRFFTEADRESGPPVAIVNQSLARRIWAYDSALGRRVRIGPDRGPWVTIVGVVQDGPEAWKAPEMYVPLAQQAANGPFRFPWYLLVRITGDRQAVAAHLQQLRGLEFRTLAEQLRVFNETINR
jgi:putative ABC transport system permease protein